VTLNPAAATVRGVGSVIVNDCVIVQLFASVAVHVYVPAHNADAVAPVPPDGVHAYVYGPVPPPTVTVAVPLHAALHVTSVCVPEIVSAVGSVIVAEAVAVHPFASVTVTV
jgi:hypothetical protein